MTTAIGNCISGSDPSQHGKYWSPEELLRMTGNTYFVTCFKDGNWKELLGCLYIKAASRERAEIAAMRLTPKCRMACATVWNPLDNIGFRQFILVTY